VGGTKRRRKSWSLFGDHDEGGKLKDEERIVHPDLAGLRTILVSEREEKEGRGEEKESKRNHSSPGSSKEKEKEKERKGTRSVACDQQRMRH